MARIDTAGHTLPSGTPRPLRPMALVLCLGSALLLTCVASSPVRAAGDPARESLAGRVLFNAGQEGETFDSFIVHYRDDAPPGEAKSVTAARIAAQLDADLTRTAKLGHAARYERPLATGGHLIRMETGKKLGDAAAADFMAALAANPRIEWIEPNAHQTLRRQPNDPHFLTHQWSLTAPQGGINVQPAWQQSTGDGVVIAILDTGSTPHPDLDRQTMPGYDFISDPASARDGDGRDADPRDEGDWYGPGECPGDIGGGRDSVWHGTHVAGIAAAQADNGIGIAGVAFGARLQHVRVLGRCGGTVADIAEAIIWASGGEVPGVPLNATPARVINLSLSGEGHCGLTYQNAIDQARQRGKVVVVAAGNERKAATGARPASCDNVFTVAATNRTGQRASYSNFGVAVDLAAPGGDCEGACTSDDPGMILSTINEGATTPGRAEYAWMSGTSMAAPMVSGVVALMRSRNPALTPEAIESHLRNSARPFPTQCVEGCGTGIVDAHAALHAAAGNPIARYPVSVSHTGIVLGVGTIASSPPGIECGPACSARFDAGTQITLTATPARGSRFDGWSGACRGSARTCTLEVDRAHAAQAWFTLPVTRLAGPATLTGLASEASPLMYRMRVPSGATSLRFSISGQANLYVRHDTQPTHDIHDCRSRRDRQTCEFPAPLAGLYYILIAGNPSFPGVTLEARYEPGPLAGQTLISGLPVEGIAAQENGARYYRIRVPASASRLRIQTWGDRDSHGDADLYLRRGGNGGGVPQPGLFDEVSAEPGNHEHLQIDNPEPATYYLLLHARSAFENVGIVASYVNTTVTTSGLGTGTVRIRRLVGHEEAAVCATFPCEASLKNATHELIATPSPGSRFDGWEPRGCDSIVAGHCRIRPDDAPHYVTARFVRGR